MVRLGTDERAAAPPPHRMNIAEVAAAVERNAVPVVFVNVLLQQLGLPVPAVPTLLLAGSLAVAPLALGQALAAAVVASVIADWVWYVARAGRSDTACSPACAGSRSIRRPASIRPRPASCGGAFLHWCSPNSSPASRRWRRRSRARCACRSRDSCWPRESAPCCGPAWRWAPAGCCAARCPMRSPMLDRNAVGAASRRRAGPGHVARVEALAEGSVPQALGRAAHHACRTPCSARGRRAAAAARPARREHGRRDRPDSGGRGRRARPPRTRGARLAERPADRHVVCVPGRRGCHPAARRLLDQGFISVRPLKGGYDAWLAAAGRNGARKVA